MIKGMDLSSLEEVEACGGKFFDENGQEDAVEILQRYGMNAVRLRLWNDPYSMQGVAYGAGTNDIEVTLRLAKRCLRKGMGFLLDFHYSDFWADPGKQILPKSWQGYTEREVEEAVYLFTEQTMVRLYKEGVKPTMVQIGNEITNGLLWPFGKKPAYDRIARFLSAGIRGVRSVDPKLPIMLHLDDGGNKVMYQEWFDHYMERGEDFQVIGLSYYPFWHGSLESLSENMEALADRYGKELIIAEVSMGYTMEDYAAYEKLSEGERKGYATRPELIKNLEVPMTKQGQADFMKDIMKRISRVPHDLGKGFYYWEPAWIPVPGSGWATWEALEYTGEKGPLGNEWANQALFDYDGHVLPALAVIRDYH